MNNVPGMTNDKLLKNNMFLPANSFYAIAYIQKYDKYVHRNGMIITPKNISVHHLRARGAPIWAMILFQHMKLYRKLSKGTFGENFPLEVLIKGNGMSMYSETKGPFV